MLPGDPVIKSAKHFRLLAVRQAVIDAQYLCVVTVMSSGHGCHLISPHDTHWDSYFIVKLRFREGN